MSFYNTVLKTIHIRFDQTKILFHLTNHMILYDFHFEYLLITLIGHLT